ncbi:Phosphate regulon transcriptional regulatory protein PhoB (SphR) [hydrothermal vent metagenome]|uniref:Phosphate regulon transcriptional regulatory protein PhoB (SphR) n=1 Tax=hydrothermal vent metagenome TaxID=652676 RepID=A0A3B1BZX5_9ZZZZ
MKNGGPCKILVVDDEEDIRDLLQYNLESAGYEVVVAKTGEEALTAIRAAKPKVVLLDLMLPGIDGLDVCKKVRLESEISETPIIMLTARGEEEDIVKGLEIGADDYVTKPFSIKEVLARIQVALRRVSEEGLPVKVEVGGLILDRNRREIFLNGKPVEFTFTEFAILDALLNRGGGVMTRDQIVAAIRGGEVSVSERSVDVHVTFIRKKLDSWSGRIHTVRGVGYRLDY